MQVCRWRKRGWDADKEFDWQFLAHSTHTVHIIPQWGIMDRNYTPILLVFLCTSEFSKKVKVPLYLLLSFRKLFTLKKKWSLFIEGEKEKFVENGECCLLVNRVRTAGMSVWTGGLAKDGGMERAVVLVWNWTESLLQTKISRLHTGSNASPSWDLQAVGLKIQPLSELRRKLHELVYE